MVRDVNMAASPVLQETGQDRSTQPVLSAIRSDVKPNGKIMDDFRLKGQSHLHTIMTTSRIVRDR